MDAEATAPRLPRRSFARSGASPDRRRGWASAAVGESARCGSAGATTPWNAFGGLEARRSLALFLAIFCCTQNFFAADLSAVRVSRVLKDVKLVPPGSGGRAVKSGEIVPMGATLRTGAAARAEITLPGPAVVRLGGKTALALSANGWELGDGLVLFQVPKQGSAPKIKTGAINAEVRGSTGLMERNGGAYVKILILEGEARIYTSRLGESIVMTAGQLLITSPKAEGLPEPVHFDIEHLYKTSLLTNNDFAPLGSRELIVQAIQKQKSDPQFIPTNLVIFGRGTLVNLVPPKPAPVRAPRPSSRP